MDLQPVLAHLTKSRAMPASAVDTRAPFTQAKTEVLPKFTRLGCLGFLSSAEALVHAPLHRKTFSLLRMAFFGLKSNWGVGSEPPALSSLWGYSLPECDTGNNVCAL
jgi:hypothetical protein